MSSLPDKAEIVQRFDEIERRLDAAVAFSLLFTRLDGDDDAHRLADRARAALADLQEARKAIDVFVGRNAIRRLREAAVACAEVLRQLAERDRALPPSSLRRHLRQAARRAPHDLASLLSFYLHFDRESRWSSDRVDKVDLLLTELSQSFGDSPGSFDSERLNQILTAFYPTTYSAIPDLERRSFQRNLETIRSEVQAADSLSQLIDGGTLKSYRGLKHRLGHLLLHPDLLTSIIETNLRLQRKIQRLNSRAVTSIFSVYQGIFETGLKGGFDPQLRQEIDQLREDFDRFEGRVKHERVRLTELEEFLTTLRKFSARLDEAVVEEPTPDTTPAPAEPQVTEESAASWLQEDLMALLDLLRENDRKGWPAEYISFSPREEFQLETREIVAFRRLEQAETVDRALELFLLKAAALRRNIKRSARMLARAPDAEISRELPVHATARQAVKLAESYLAHYSRAVEQAILDGDVAEAQQLQILRMRLVRESAGIWLQVFQSE